MGLESKPIIKNASVDNVTLEVNGEGQMQVKGGAVSEDLLEASLSSKLEEIGEVLYEGSANTNLITFAKQNNFKRLKIFMQKSAANTSFPEFQFNGLTSNYDFVYVYNGTWGGSYNQSKIINYLSANALIYGFSTIEIVATNGRIKGNYQSSETNGNFFYICNFENSASSQNYLNSFRISKNSSSCHIKIIGYKN